MKWEGGGLLSACWYSEEFGWLPKHSINTIPSPILRYLDNDKTAFLSPFPRYLLQIWCVSLPQLKTVGKDHMVYPTHTHLYNRIAISYLAIWYMIIKTGLLCSNLFSQPFPYIIQIQQRCLSGCTLRTFSLRTDSRPFLRPFPRLLRSFTPIWFGGSAYSHPRLLGRALGFHLHFKKIISRKFWKTFKFMYLGLGFTLWIWFRDLL